MDNLDQILCNHSVSLKQPAMLCPVSRSVLMYKDGTEQPPEIGWLDCSTIPPKEIGQKNIIFPAEIEFLGYVFRQGRSEVQG